MTLLDLDDLERRLYIDHGTAAERLYPCDPWPQALCVALLAELRRLRSALEAVGGMQIEIGDKAVVLLPMERVVPEMQGPGMLPENVHPMGPWPRGNDPLSGVPPGTVVHALNAERDAKLRAALAKQPNGNIVRVAEYEGSTYIEREVPEAGRTFFSRADDLEFAPLASGETKAIVADGQVFLPADRNPRGAAQWSKYGAFPETSR